MHIPRLGLQPLVLGVRLQRLFDIIRDAVFQLICRIARKGNNQNLIDVHGILFPGDRLHDALHEDLGLAGARCGGNQDIAHIRLNGR